MDLSEKVKRINHVLYEFFENPHSPRVVEAKDMMQEFIKAGIFAKDTKNGKPIRDVLRDLDDMNALNAIPFVLVERKTKNRNWFFSKGAFEARVKEFEVEVEEQDEDTEDACASEVPTEPTQEKGMLNCFPPFIDGESEILVLGTMPGPESLRTGQYYTSPNNKFWKIISYIYNKGVKFGSYDEKTECLHSNHIALWDVFASCTREGAADSSIKNQVPNDIEGLLKDYPSIRLIILNGQKAAQGFYASVPTVVVKSSASYFKFEDILNDWKKCLMSK